MSLSVGVVALFLMSGPLAALPLPSLSFPTNPPGLTGTANRAPGEPAILPGHGIPRSAGAGERSAASTSYELWTPVVTPTAPPPRTEAMMAFDPAEGAMLLFGGGNPTSDGGWSVLGDTWIFANDTWTNLTVNLTTAPPARSDGSMAYDPDSGGMILFGGRGGTNGTELFNDTWSFQSGAWTELSPSSSPPARFQGAMTWDNDSADALLFGGCADANCSSLLNDTWTFANGTWSNRTGSVSPPGRAGEGLAYDAGASYDLLFGGEGTTGPLNDSWAFESGNWTALSTPTAPAPRAGAEMAYDPAAGSMVLYGGEGASAIFSDTWGFANGTWTEWAPTTWYNPGPAAFAGMDFDPIAGTLVLAGGSVASGVSSNSTWELTGTPGPEYLQAEISPSSCGPITILPGRSVSNGAPFLLDLGSYTIAAAPCTGYLVSGWSVSGALSIPADEVTSATANLTVTGTGNLTLTYLPDYPVTISVTPAACSPITVNPVGYVLNGQTVYLTTGVHQIGAPACVGYQFEVWTVSGQLVLYKGHPNDSSSLIQVIGSGELGAVYVPLHAVEFLIRPPGCGPIEVAPALYEPNGSSLDLENGSYLITAPECAGFLFTAWATSGALAVPRPLANVSGATLNVSGPGTLTAVYEPLYTVLFATSPSSCGLDSIATPSGIVSGGSVALANGTYLVTAPVCIGYSFAYWATTGLVGVSAGATYESSAPVLVRGPGAITAVFAPLYSIDFVVVPTSCGSVRVGVNGQVGTSGVALLANGTYLIEAPSCSGYVFESWDTAGAVSIASAEVDLPTAELSVSGAGITTAVFAINLSVPAPSHSSSTSWYTLTPLGLVLGAIAGVAAGLAVGVLLVRRHRGVRRPGSKPPRS